MGFAGASLRGMGGARICAAGEVPHAVREPFLGQLPMVPSNGDLLADMGPMVTESGRIVRTALLERLDQSRSNVILVTSSTGQQGKTTFAVLMSRSLALLGKKTLLVEAELRRPSMATRLSLNPENGLAALLTGRADEASSISRTEIPGLDVLMAGQADMAFNPELLANGVMGACLERWRKTYDFVVLDAPPVLPVADARILAGQADGTVLVMRATHSRRGEVVQAYADLCASGGKLVGTVLMGTQLSANYGYYGSYQTYFDRSHTLEAKV